MKLLIDMNLSPRWVEALAVEGIEAVHWSAIGAPDATDTEIMRHAVQNGFVVFTMTWTLALSWRQTEARSQVSFRYVAMSSIRPG